MGLSGKLDPDQTLSQFGQNILRQSFLWQTSDKQPIGKPGRGSKIIEQLSHFKGVLSS
jgi:hypothetical protein